MAAVGKTLKLREDVVYVVQLDRASGSSFDKGDRVKLVGRPNSSNDKSDEFMHEDGRRVPLPYINVTCLEEAEMQIGPALTVSDIKPGVVYVVREHEAYFSSFMKGDRVVLLEGGTTTGTASRRYRHEDGREVMYPVLRPRDLAFAEKKEEVKADKELTHADIKPDEVYVVLKDGASGSSFKLGDRVKLRPGYLAGSEHFVRENGALVTFPYVRPRYLKLAEKESAVEKKLTNADLKHGEIYVVTVDYPSCSSYATGDRVMLRPGSKPIDHHFQFADGRRADCPYVGPEFLRRETAAGTPAVEGPKWVPATQDDLKVGAVFKVEDGHEKHYHLFEVGTVVEFTGRYYLDAEDMIRMVALNGTRKGTEQWMKFSQISLLVPGQGEVIQRTPKKGTGKLRKSATRSDAYDFKLMDCGKAGYYIEAGCRWFTMADAVKHWTDTRSGTDLGRETFDILDLFSKHIDRLNAAKKKGA